MTEVSWYNRGPARKGCLCQVCGRPDGDVFERAMWTPFMLRCRQHGPGIDGRRESDRPDWFRACFGCGHVYRTEADLLAEENYVRDLLRMGFGDATLDATSVTEVSRCPLCSRDWEAVA